MGITPIGQSSNGDFAVLVPISVPRIRESLSVDSVPLCFQSPRKNGEPKCPAKLLQD